MDPRFVPGFLLLSLVIRLMVAFTVDATPELGDFTWYNEKAMGISEGQGYVHEGVHTAYWPVGYPAFLGGLYRMFGPHLLVATVANALLLVGSLILTYTVSRRILDSEIGARWTLLLMGVFPNHLAYTGIVASEPLFLFLLLLSVHLYLHVPSIKGRLLSGMSLGFTCLVRPVVLLFPPFLFLLLCISVIWSMVSRARRIGSGKNAVGSGESVGGSGNEVDVGSGNEVDVGSGNEVDVGSGNEVDVGSGNEVDVGSGNEVDVGSGNEVDVGSGNEVDVGSGNEVDVGSGNEVADTAVNEGSPWSITNEDMERLVMGIRTLVLVGLGMFLVLSPWMVRNHEVSGEWVVVSTNGGYNFLMGHNPNTTGGFQPFTDGDVSPFVDANHTEFQVDRNAREQGMEYIRGNPGMVLVNAPKKLVSQYGYDNEGLAHLWIQNEDAGGPWEGVMFLGRVLNAGLYYLMLGATLVSVIFMARDPERVGKDGWFGALFILYISLIAIAFVGDARYHYPTIPFMAIHTVWLLLNMTGTERLILSDQVVKDGSVTR